VQTEIRPSTIRTLVELEEEMEGAQRTSQAEAIREVLTALTRAGRGWLTTGQAAELLGVTIPTVKDWIRRGTLSGLPVGSRWRVSKESVDKVLQVREMLTDMAEDDYPTDDEIRELTRQVRRQMNAEKAPALE
jgi:excisionase family DNA binding protein